MYATHSPADSYPAGTIREVIRQAENTMTAREIAVAHSMPIKDVEYILEHAPSWMGSRARGRGTPNARG